MTSRRAAQPQHTGRSRSGRGRAEQRRRRVVLVAVAALAIGPLAAVTVGSGPAGTPASTSTVAPLATPPGASSSTRQELSEPCAKAVAPIRALMDEHDSARALPPAERQVLNDGIGAATATCSADEWGRFHDRELLHWLQRS